MDWSQFNVLAAARQDSLATLAQLATHFAQATARIKPIAAIVAAGSLGRLEIHRSSDLDCVLLQRPGESDPKVVEDAIDMVMAIIEKNGLKPPKRDGIYRNAITVDALCASTAHGDLGESAAIFGKRLQMLLDTRAVIGNAPRTAPHGGE